MRSQGSAALVYVCVHAASCLDIQQCHGLGPAFYAQAESDFAPFHRVSIPLANKAKSDCQHGSACFVVQIVQGRLYVSNEQAGFQSRNRLTMAFLQRVAMKFGPLPDAEFVVDTSDGHADIETPTFVIAKFATAPGGILYPDFSSFAWPESECPTEALGSHCWHQAVSNILSSAPSWEEKDTAIFWRGAATSAYRKQVLPQLAAVPDSNVSFMQWELSPEGRQHVRGGTCIPLQEWCRYQFLANLPGNTMTLSLKYRLLCGSVILSSPLWFQEWFYNLLIPGVHYVEVDPMWKSAAELLVELRRGATEPKAADIAAAAKELAKTVLTEDNFDCYWRYLVQLAHEHLPRPVLTAASIPLELAMLKLASKNVQTPQAMPQLDVAVVIPACASDMPMMEHARATWLRQDLTTTWAAKHFFALASEDPDLRLHEPMAEDILVVNCPHGYTNLLLKMSLAYRMLLRRFDVSYFVRADVDSVLPLGWLFCLLAAASSGNAVVKLDPDEACLGTPLWAEAASGQLPCQSACALDRQCEFFVVDKRAGNCITFSRCSADQRFQLAQESYIDAFGVAVHNGELYQYSLRDVVQGMGARRGACSAPKVAVAPFILGTVLYGNKVLRNDTYNPQWNNIGYTHDLGLTVYPPYPEASGYVMSADVAAFIASIGDGSLKRLAWKAWAIEDAAMGTALAGLDIAWYQLPTEIRDLMRVIQKRPR
mmetsp:Transcript_39648/g.91523  ORF Transcript_39648/g.91523 Transcript_39648/m.91523 type:complete len:710 (+) Transcript_39648:72-2201(+)